MTSLCSCPELQALAGPLAFAVSSLYFVPSKSINPFDSGLRLTPVFTIADDADFKSLKISRCGTTVSGGTVRLLPSDSTSS